MNDDTFPAGYIERTIITPVAIWKPIKEAVEEPVPTPPVPPLPPLPNGELLEKAREAWIAYSTPIWRQAGRSDEWIAQNIINEWTTSKEDILHRYLTEDFVPSPPTLTPPAVDIKLGSYLPWLFAGFSFCGFLVAIGTKKESE